MPEPADPTETPSQDPRSPFFDRIARVKPHLGPALKALNVSWFLSLSVGVIFIVYSFSIGFFPELDLQQSFTLLVSAALIGVFLLLWLCIIFLLPGWVFLRKGEGEKHQVFWFLLIVCYLFSISLALAYEESASGWAFIIAAVVVTALATLLYYVHTEEWKRAADMTLRALMASVFSFVALWVILQFNFSKPEIVKLCIVVIGFNVFVVIAPHSSGERKSGMLWLNVTLFTVFIVVLLFQIGPTFIPRAVMRIYKFGHFQAASLVLTEKACEIGTNHGLSETRPCHFSDVRIHSRLGSTYYIEGRTDDEPVCFTIPSSEVLSWTFNGNKQPSEKGWRNGCNQVNRNQSAAGADPVKSGQ